MRRPVLEGVIERRLLVNYRVDPEVARRLLPAPFEPIVVNSWAVAGVCLLRLGHLRPLGLPAGVGRRSENAAHRIAVTWETPEGSASGVYIPRRDSDSWLNVLIGGRIFPGSHRHARFDVVESDESVFVSTRSDDGEMSIAVSARVTDTLVGSQLFDDLASASHFFESGAIGYSSTADPQRFDGMRLETSAWRVEPLELESVRSSFFDDGPGMDPAQCELDCGLLMRRVPVTWHSLAPLRCPAAARDAYAR